MKAQPDFGDILSPLENDVLRLLWPDRHLKVRGIYQQLKRKRKLALCSVAVILDRLHDKGLVKRDIEKARGGFCYIYYPVKDKDTFEKSVVEKTVDSLIQRFGPTAVSYFNERFANK